MRSIASSTLKRPYYSTYLLSNFSCIFSLVQDVSFQILHNLNQHISGNWIRSEFMDSGLFILNILGNICKCPIHSIHYLQYLFCPSLQVKHIYACNKHFDDTQYNQTQLRMHAMGLRSKPPQLLPDAVPHIFSPGPSPSTRHQASYSRKMVGNVCCIINLIYTSVLQSIDNCAYC